MRCIKRLFSYTDLRIDRYCICSVLSWHKLILCHFKNVNYHFLIIEGILHRFSINYWVWKNNANYECWQRRKFLCMPILTKWITSILCALFRASSFHLGKKVWNFDRLNDKVYIHQYHYIDFWSYLFISADLHMSPWPLQQKIKIR